jgi:hypothetical protein
VNYPLLNLFWTIFLVFVWFMWCWILITVFIDIFRSSDLSGWGKALWFLFVLLIPLVGVLVYLIARGGSMHDRAARVAEQQDAAVRSYVREAAAPESASPGTGLMLSQAGAGAYPWPGPRGLTWVSSAPG